MEDGVAVSAGVLGRRLRIRTRAAVAVAAARVVPGQGQPDRVRLPAVVGLGDGLGARGDVARFRGAEVAQRGDCVVDDYAALGRGETGWGWERGWRWRSRVGGGAVSIVCVCVVA